MTEASTALAATSNKSKRGEHLAPHRWKPGQSGNPAGMPKGTSMKEMRAIARANFSVAAARLVELIKSDNEAIALQAVQFAYLYALGKPQEGGDLEHRDSMQARHQELVVSPEPPPELPAPEAVAAPALTAKVEAVAPPPVELPPEAAGGSLPAASVPSGLRCMYHGKGGEQCQDVAPAGAQWCQPHQAKLFALVGG